MTKQDEVEEILSKYPPSTESNARSIIRSKIKSFSDRPSESKKQELENLGFTIDFSEGDWGNGPRGGY